MSDEEFLQVAYRAVLRRSPDEDALAVWRSGAGGSRSGLVRALVTSEEFQRLLALDDNLVAAAEARARGQPLRNLSAPATVDERALEIPWVLSRYRAESHVLDVGYAFADPIYLAGLVGLGASELFGVDLASTDVPGMSTVQADVRQLPFPDRRFEAIFCVSTLEHVGRDNRVYGLPEEEDVNGMPAALSELGRVLSSGGRMLITVPCGEYEDHGWFVQQEVDAWLRLFAEAGFDVREQETYQRAPEGWRSVTSFNEAGVRYGDRGPGASAVLCAELALARRP
jgi:SAM-dependent methyltransferase